MKRILMFCPCDNSPQGGINVIYNNVDILNKNGFDAYVLHEINGFRCTWFNNNTKIMSLQNYIVNPKEDVIVIPEIYGLNINNLWLGVKKVIFNQGAYLTFNSYEVNQFLNSPYLNEDVIGVIVVSEDSKKYLEYCFKNIKINRIVNRINNYGIKPDIKNKKKTITLIVKNNIKEIIQIINILNIRNNLNGYIFDLIQNDNHENVIRRMEQSRIFISLLSQEGFGLAVVEAISMGCIVVGYHGQGGKEFFKSDFCYEVEQGDIIGVCQKVEEVIKLIDENEIEYLEKINNGMDFVLSQYSNEAQEKSIVESWNEILDRF